MQSNSGMPRRDLSPMTSLNNNVNRDPRIIMTDDPATPIHTSFAKVYTMNPSNKIWMPATQAAVPVSFYFDKHRSVYRIISYEGSKLVINCTITPTMTFLKPSSTFGLWSDTKLRIIFGLGFSNQSFRDQASEWFDKVVKAAAALEQCLPLPPPANTAVSLEFNGDPSGWSINAPSSMQSNNEDYVPPKTVHLVDSNLDLSRENESNSYPNLLMDEYEIRNQSGPSAEITQLALKTLQYDREASKLKQLEAELSHTRATLGKVHENLMRKSTDVERLKKEILETKEKLQTETTRAEVAENSLEDEKQRVVKLNEELEKLRDLQTEQLANMEGLKGHNKEMENENEILRERLRQTRMDVDMSDKKLDTADSVCLEMGDKIEELMNLNERLKISLSGLESTRK